MAEFNGQHIFICGRSKMFGMRRKNGHTSTIDAPTDVLEDKRRARNDKGNQNTSLTCSKSSGISVNPTERDTQKRMTVQERESQQLREILSKIYTRKRILQFESIFGRTFISSGGESVTAMFVKKLNLLKGGRVLDLGCGIGGGAFYMTKKYHVEVTAIDITSSMVEVALERAEEHQVTDKTVEFEIADASLRTFAPSTFDAVYSKDVFLHIPRKLSLLRNIFNYLKPGGKLLVSDYCFSDGSHSDGYKDYLKECGFHILTPSEYRKILQSAGFMNIHYEDLTRLFIRTTREERSRMDHAKEEFIEKFSMEDFNMFCEMMDSKEEIASRGDQVWVLFYAEKPGG